MDQHLAIIDIGSNTVRLVIYEMRQTSFKEIENMKASIRLGSYLTDANVMQIEGIERLIGVLQNFRSVIKRNQVLEVKCVATAAIRVSKNQADITTLVKEQTGFCIQVLTGEEEAQYGCIAVTEALAFDHGLSIDLGGASMEVALFENRKVICTHSFPFGAVTIKNRFVQGNRMTTKEKKQLQVYLEEQFAAHAWMKNKNYVLAALGGSARNLAQIDQLNQSRSSLGVHGYEISKFALKKLRSSLSKLRHKELLNIDVLSRERADIILPALEIFHSFMKYTEAEKMVINSRGIREGIVFNELSLQRENLLNKYALAYQVKARGTIRLLDRYEVNIERCRDRAMLALQFLQELRRIQVLHISEEDEFWLEQASLLFYIGAYISKRVQDQTTFSMLMNSTLDGYTPKEKVKLAIMASFKNHSTFKQMLAPYEEWFSKHEKRQMRIFGAMLKFCFNFNGSKRNVLEKIQASLRGDYIILQIYCINDCLPEKDRGEKQKKHLIKALRRPIQLEFQ